MRSISEVMDLIGEEGMAGYGIYWALTPLKQQLKIRQPKLDKVLYGFGLFICNGNTFFSPKLSIVVKTDMPSLKRINAKSKKRTC